MAGRDTHPRGAPHGTCRRRPGVPRATITGHSQTGGRQDPPDRRVLPTPVLNPTWGNKTLQEVDGGFHLADGETLLSRPPVAGAYPAGSHTCSFSPHRLQTQTPAMFA